MKKPALLPAARKKSRKHAKPTAKKAAPPGPVKPAGPPGASDDLQLRMDRLKETILEKIDAKFNTLNIRFDRLENAIQEVLDEIRESDSFLEEETEPYEGQA